MEPGIPPRLSIRSAAKWANVSERTLRRMVADGRVSIEAFPGVAVEDA